MDNIIIVYRVVGHDVIVINREGQTMAFMASSKLSGIHPQEFGA